MYGHVNIQVSQSVLAVPFRVVILIINIAHINIGLCCSVINKKQCNILMGVMQL